MIESERSQRRIARLAWVMAWTGLVVGQLHALSRFATADGREDLRMPLTAAWARPASEALAPLLTWADPDVVYVTYGKVWFPVFLAFTLLALVVYGRRAPVGLERWAWRVAIAGYAASTAGVFLGYWTQWTGRYDGGGVEAMLFGVAFAVTVPGLLVTLVGSTVLGTVLLARRFRPASAALLLALVVPLDLVILQVTSLGSAALPVMFAFAILGRRIARDAEPAPSLPAAEVARTA